MQTSHESPATRWVVQKNKAVTLTFDSGSITLKEFTATTFHVNDDTYQISDSKFKQK